MDKGGVVYIDRLYDDPWPGPSPPWPRIARLGDDREWQASTGGTTAIDEEASFNTVEEAIAWGRDRADVVLVRLGSNVGAAYSAGVRAATWFTDGSGWPFPPWPPATWPDYQGPPEPGWPDFEAPERD